MADRAALFHKNGIAVTNAQLTLLSEYIRMLEQENAHQNLTAVRDTEEIWVRHILDAAMLLHRLPENAKHLVDIGTGGGIPGIPLSILRPDLYVTLLDSELRKIEFCAAAVKMLRLNAEAICGRAEELAHTATFRGTYDIAVSRAMAAGSMLCELAIPMLKPGGILLAMKGRGYDPTVERFAEACETLGAEVTAEDAYALCEEQKHLIICRKNAETPAQYPRRFAKIKRSPL